MPGGLVSELSLVGSLLSGESANPAGLGSLLGGRQPLREARIMDRLCIRPGMIENVPIGGCLISRGCALIAIRGNLIPCREVPIEIRRRLVGARGVLIGMEGTLI